MISAYKATYGSEADLINEKNIYYKLNQIEEILVDSPFYICSKYALEVALIIDHSIKNKVSSCEIDLLLNSTISSLLLFKNFECDDYFNGNIKQCEDWDCHLESNPDYYKSAKYGFNYFWPKTTTKQDIYLMSSMMAKNRLLSMFSEHNINLDKIQSVLDIGCGPGRYLYALDQLMDKTKLFGCDVGTDIINVNRNNLLLSDISFFEDDVLVKTKSEKYDFVLCNGVAHHTGVSLEKIVKRHADLINKGGFYFIFVYGSGGLELYSWKFLQRTLGRFTKESVYSHFSNHINPLRLQGILDHTYGSFYETTREEMETYLDANFSSYKRLSGVAGLDITPEIYKDDPYFQLKCGTGNLRYICGK